MSTSYTTASAVPGIIADPATLDTQAVRCLWMRPVLDKDGKAAFLPSVVFKDGTDCPLACEMSDLHARQFCQRLSAVYDWPVKDGRVLEGDADVAADRAFAALDEGDRMEKDGQGLVSVSGIGRMAAIMAHDAGLPLGVAIEGVTGRLALFFAKMADEAVMQPHVVKKNLRAATEAAIVKLTELYGTDERGPGAYEISPERLGVMVADYHHAKGSTDELFQKGLTAALEAREEAWGKEKNRTAETESKMVAVLDAGIRHWFRLTGRKIVGD